MAVLELSTDPGREPDRIDVQHLALEPDEGVILRFPQAAGRPGDRGEAEDPPGPLRADPAGEAARQ